MVYRWTLRSQLPSTPTSNSRSDSNTNTTAAASTMLLPLLMASMAWAYVLALGEKLQLELESLYSGSVSTTSPTTPPEPPSPSSLSTGLGQAAPAFTAPVAPVDKSAAAEVAARRTSTSYWGRKLPPASSSSTTKHSEVLLPPACTTSRTRSTDKTLVLDLDETLILARGDAREMGEEQRFDFMLRFQDQLPQQQDSRRSRGLVPRVKRVAARASGGLGKEGQQPPPPRRVYVRKRPHLREFLEAVSEMFEVVLFTAAPEAFATAVLEQIDPERSFVDHVLSRANCTRFGSGTIRSTSRSSSCRTWGGRGGEKATGVSSNGRRRRRGSTSMVKDLGIIGRPLSKVIMVDNSLDAIRYHLENGVHISSFYGNREDTDLLSTLDALKTLAPAADVRDGIIRISVETQARKEGHILTLDDASPK